MLCGREKEEEAASRAATAKDAPAVTESRRGSALSHLLARWMERADHGALIGI